MRESRHSREYTYRNVLGPLQRGEQEAQVAVAEALADAHELAQRQDGGLSNEGVSELSPLVSHDSHLPQKKREQKSTCHIKSHDIPLLPHQQRFAPAPKKREQKSTRHIYIPHNISTTQTVCWSVAARGTAVSGYTVERCTVSAFTVSGYTVNGYSVSGYTVSGYTV